jgi:hypothetical protein
MANIGRIGAGTLLATLNFRQGRFVLISKFRRYLLCIAGSKEDHSFHCRFQISP